MMKVIRECADVLFMLSQVWTTSISIRFGNHTTLNGKDIDRHAEAPCDGHHGHVQSAANAL